MVLFHRGRPCGVPFLPTKAGQCSRPFTFFHSLSRKRLRLDRAFSRWVPGAGLEPARPHWPMDFKSIVSTNSTTRAIVRRRSDSNRWMTVLQTAPLDHLGTTPKILFDVGKKLANLICLFYTKRNNNSRIASIFISNAWMAWCCSHSWMDKDKKPAIIMI